jgi:hypothetical protein
MSVGTVFALCYSSWFVGKHLYVLVLPAARFPVHNSLCRLPLLFVTVVCSWVHCVQPWLPSLPVQLREQFALAIVFCSAK